MGPNRHFTANFFATTGKGTSHHLAGPFAYHPLHAGVTLVGEHLRYAITYKGRWLGVATWSGAAFHIKDRDKFIGWDSEQCRRRRALLANNSRLLILPDCHYPNLISRFMKLMLARLSEDWLERWGHPVVMVETFGDPRLYQGTAYKVSGWSHLGKTAGWKRDAADYYLKHDAPKQIWVRELVKRAAGKLRAERLPPAWAMVEAETRLRCTRTVKEIHSLMEALWKELPEFRRAQALARIFHKAIRFWEGKFCCRPYSCGRGEPVPFQGFSTVC